MKGKKLNLKGTRITWSGPADVVESSKIIEESTSQLHLGAMLGKVYDSGADGIMADELAAYARELVVATGEEKDVARVTKCSDERHVGWLVKKWAQYLTVTGVVEVASAEETAAVTEEAAAVTEEALDEEAALAQAAAV
jgi:hypothetical protein